MKHREYNPYKEAMEEWTWDQGKEEFTIKSTFDVSSIIKANKRTSNDSLDQRFGNQMMHSVAEIPLSMVTQFKTKYNVDVFSEDPTEQLKLRKLLDSPDYRYLKTTTKRLWRPRAA